MTPLAWVAVPLLGGVASVLRVLVARGGGPGAGVGTFLVNVTGSFALGVLTASGATGVTLTLIGTATIGTYTTFSTWMLDTHRLHAAGEPSRAAMNLVLSLGLGLAAFGLGYAVG